MLYRYRKVLDMDASSRVVLKDVYRDYEKDFPLGEELMASATGLMEGYPDGTVRPRNGEKRSRLRPCSTGTVSISWTCNPIRSGEWSILQNSFFVNLV